MSKPMQILGAATLLLFCFGSPLDAQGEKRPIDREPVEFTPPPWHSMRVGLDVLVDGKPLNTIRHAGRTYVPVSRFGVEYTIRVWNHGPRRVVAMVSVDGLSVLNGKPASEDHPGYIVVPQSSIVIKGWRRNMDTVAAFSFQERDKSYASLMGRPEYIGVIGLIAIEEQATDPRALQEKGDATRPAAPNASKVLGSTGTGYGRDVDSRIYYVPFVRSGNRRTLTMYYDTRDGLRRAGVPLDRPFPVPFPQDTDFAPAPPGDPRR